MGASLGAIGTARAQYHLRQILVALNLFTLNQPEVVIADAAHRFDENGNLIHEPTKQLIQELLKNLVDWTRRISPAPAREVSPDPNSRYARNRSGMRVDSTIFTR